MQPRTLNRWLDVNPVSKLTRTQSYFIVPAFTITDAQFFTYSNLVGAFNYEAPRNFRIKSNNLPNYAGICPLDDPNYILCVMWMDCNHNTHRYKFWENRGEVFYFPVSLYNGQLINQNFRIEIWSVGIDSPGVHDVVLDESSTPVVAEGEEHFF